MDRLCTLHRECGDGAVVCGAAGALGFDTAVQISRERVPTGWGERVTGTLCLAPPV